MPAGWRRRNPAGWSCRRLRRCCLHLHHGSRRHPTQLNRQGPDIGDQYRTGIFYVSPEQEQAARASKERLAQSGRYRRPIVTEIVPAQPFYRAEEYHQGYLEKNGLTG